MIAQVANYRRITMFTLLITLILADSTGTTIDRTTINFANEKTCMMAAQYLSKKNRTENIYRQFRAGLKPVYIRDYACVPYAFEPPKKPEAES